MTQIFIDKVQKISKQEILVHIFVAVDLIESTCFQDTEEWQ